MKKTRGRKSRVRFPLSDFAEPKFFFRIRIHKFFPDSDTDSDPKTNILAPFIFQKVPLIAFICVLEPVRQK
jgi:hypothetical protein